MTLSRRVMDAVLVQETSPSGRARQRFEAASQHEEGEDGAREAWEAELMQALKDEREVSHAMLRTLNQACSELLQKQPVQIESASLYVMLRC